MIYEFDVFRIDDINRVLTRENEETALQARAFDCLLYLVRHPGRLITKVEMMEAVWANSFVEESSLTVAICTIRRTVGEEHGERRFIQTVPGRGYRFICEVHAAVEITDLAPAPGSPLGRPTSLAERPEESLSPTAVESAKPESISASTPLHRSLRAWAWSLAATITLMAVLLLGWSLWRGAHPVSSVSSLAILPFSNEIPSDQDDALMLKTVDKMITDLGGTVPIRCMSSVLQYASPNVDAAAIGRQEKVDAVVTGRVARSGNSLTAHLTMLRSEDGKVLWKKDFSTTGGDMAPIGKEIEDELRKQLPHRLALASHLPPAKENKAASEEAYQSYLRGRYLWNRRTDKSLERSIEYYKQSIQLDPNFALAYAGLADSYAIQASFSLRPGTSCGPDARAAALGALALDPSLAEPHTALGMASFFADWDGRAAEKEFQQSITMDPNYATTHHWYALDLAAMGRMPQARYEIRRAQELEPLSLMIRTNVGWILYLSRDYQHAINAYEKVIELDPTFARARTRLGIVQMQTGDLTGAIANLKIAENNSGGDAYIDGLLGQAEAMAGQRSAAELKLKNLKKLAATQYVPPISVALIYMGLHEDDQALNELQEGFKDHSTALVYAKVDPSLDRLRDDPRFKQMLASMRF